MREPASSRSTYGALIAAVFVFLLLVFLYSVADTLLLFFIAALVALYLSGLTDFLERRLGVPRSWGLLLSILLSISGLTGVGWLVVPPVLRETQGLLETFPTLLVRWREELLALTARYPLLADLLPSPEQTIGYVDAALGNLAGYFADIFPYLFSGLNFLIHLVSVAVMAIYLTVRPSLYQEGAVALVPPVHRDLARSIFSDLGTTLRAWIVGQVLAMIVLGVLTWAGLMVLGVPYALAFGVFTGIAVMVPFFGTLISTLLPALFVLGSQGPFQAFLVVMLGVLVHLFEANFVHPIIMERQINLPPVLSILAVLMMAELLGAIGLIVAVPTLATAIVLIRRVYIHRLLEGRGFRRFVRDAPLEIRLPAGVGAVHPAALELNIPAYLERIGAK